MNSLSKNIGERLEKYRKMLNMSRDAVVNHPKISISKSTLQAWEGGEREPSLSGLHELAELYDVTPYTLIFEEEPETPAFLYVSESDYEHIPFYRAEASAGHGSFLDEHRQPTHHLAFRKRWITYHGFSIKDLVGLIAKGDSMEPTIQNNAAIIIDTSRNEAMDGNVYVIRMGDRLWVKRTQWLVDGLRLISDNDFYAPIDITREQMQSEGVEVIGQVVHTAYDLVG